LSRGSWDIVKFGYNTINAPILNLKLFQLNIPIKKNIHLPINIGLTPIMIVIFIIVNTFIQELKQEILQSYQEYMYNFFVLVSSNKNKIQYIQPSQIKEHTDEDNKKLYFFMKIIIIKIFMHSI
jgi:hypothetical protein